MPIFKFTIPFSVLLVGTGCLHPLKLSLTDLSADELVKADSLGAAAKPVRIEYVDGTELQGKNLVIGATPRTGTTSIPVTFTKCPVARLPPSHIATTAGVLIMVFPGAL